MQQVHLRINDADTGKPTPVRLRITDAAGNYYAPHGRLTEFATGVNQDVGGNVMTGAKKWAYIDGACEILLPPGPLHIEITKGPEYTPIDEEITLLAGKMALRFEIKRWSDVRKQGWYSGDTRVHFLSPDAALLEGQAEDVAVVNLLAMEAESDRLRSIPNILSFSGQSYCRKEADCGVAVNTFNRCPGLGSLVLLHCHRVVYPLTLGNSEALAGWTLADWCDQCHRKKGLVIWVTPRLVTADFDYGEGLADLILGKIDAIEITPKDAAPSSALADYYQLANAGLVVPLVGASGKTCNAAALGSMRTYAQTPTGSDITYTNWIDAVRLGRTFASNGPLLHWKIDGAVPEGSIELESLQTISVEVRAESWRPFDHLELIKNGNVVATSTPVGASPSRAELAIDLPIEAGGWLAARCVTDRTMGTDPLPFAHTSAIPIRVRDRASIVDGKSVRELLADLDGLLGWSRIAPNGRQLQQVVEEARTILAKKLSS